MNMRGTSERPQRGQQLRPRRGEREEHDERDRRRDPRDDEPGRGQALLGEADAMTEPGAERHDDVAVGDEAERRRQHDDAR